jgi:hypothetical protein
MYKENIIKTRLSLGDTVYWVHCSNKIYKGIVREFSFCEDQGAVYLILDSPSFKINPNPIVHYSHCFISKEQAQECIKDYDDWNKMGMIRCDRCYFERSKTT